jgi:hypothetical protein
LTKLYDSKDSHYAIKYPASWEYDASDKGTVIFSGRPGSPSYYSTINIQTILTKKTGGEYATVKQFIADIRKQASAQSKGVKFLENGPITLPQTNGDKMSGEYLIFSYQYHGMAFKQWQIVVLRNDAQVFYAWAYTAPLEQYDVDLSIAKKMLESWSVY